MKQLMPQFAPEYPAFLPFTTLDQSGVNKINLARTITLLIALYSGGACAIEITDFKFGLVCPNADSNVGWVCHETKDILITGQGQCVFDGNKVPCTWYGFSFNYANARASDVIRCTYTMSQPVTMGNPTGIVSRETNEGKYEFSVPVGAGSFFNPQYSVFAIEKRGRETQQEHTECRINGKPAFSFDANFIFPSE